jgi:hypothetical protein
MSTTKSQSPQRELINDCMNELARELGAMNPDPRAGTAVAELRQEQIVQEILRLSDSVKRQISKYEKIPADLIFSAS